MKATTVGLDIGKSVVQVHVEDAAGRSVARRRLRRAQVTTFFARLPASVVGIEACGSAHYWGRTLRALGHEVRLLPAAYVRPFVRRNKTDTRDAAAIGAALRHPDMRFLGFQTGLGAWAGNPRMALKSAEQQASRGLERARELLVKQHTQLVAAGDARLPGTLVPVLRLPLEQIAHLAAAIAQLEDRIVTAARADPAMRRLATIPGGGPILAHAIVAAAGDGRQFGAARDFAAWAGLTPRTYASASKRRDKGISRQGDRRLRTLFALGARATAWQRGILARRPVEVAVLAQAAKTARIAWAVLVSGAVYQPHRQAHTLAAA